MTQSASPCRAAVAVALTVAASACAPPTPDQPGFRIRLLTSVPLSGRWEREAERGLGLVAAELGADIARSRAPGVADLRERLRAQAADGVDLIFCVGPEVEAVVFTEAAAYPDTDFVIIPGELHGANLASISFLPEEAGYLAGAVAASLADEPVIGLLRGAGRPWLERLEAGFIAGFSASHPEAVTITARGNDGPWELASAGARLALYSTDRADPGVLAAVHDAGLVLIAADPGLVESERDLVVAAVVIDVAEAMLRVAREVRDRSFRGQVYTFDLGSGALDLVLNPGFAGGQRMTDLTGVLERARSEITAGWVEIEELGIGRPPANGGAPVSRSSD
jgi:basic membrane lipoprotein Med (substrate-binding protein (PBP1-ABC) superfamily)